MRKVVLTITILVFTSAATTQAQKASRAKEISSPEPDDFFINDPRAVEYYRNHPQEKANSDKDRQLVRDEEFKRTKVKWTALIDAGIETREMILKSNPAIKDELRKNGLYIDVAYTDFDHDGKPDLVFYNWADGRADGFNYTVVFGKAIKPNRKFFGIAIQPHKNGILVDKAYYIL